MKVTKYNQSCLLIEANKKRILVFQLKKSNIIFVRKGSLLSEIMSTIVKLILIILVIGVIGWNLVL